MLPRSEDLDGLIHLHLKNKGELQEGMRGSHPLSGHGPNPFNAASSQKTLRIKLISAVMEMALGIA